MRPPTCSPARMRSTRSCGQASSRRRTGFRRDRVRGPRRWRAVRPGVAVVRDAASGRGLPHMEITVEHSGDALLAGPRCGPTTWRCVQYWIPLFGQEHGRRRPVQRVRSRGGHRLDQGLFPGPGARRDGQAPRAARRSWLVDLDVRAPPSSAARPCAALHDVGRWAPRRPRRLAFGNWPPAALGVLKHDLAVVGQSVGIDHHGGGVVRVVSGAPG